jgi:hypothetical protein
MWTPFIIKQQMHTNKKHKIFPQGSSVKIRVRKPEGPPTIFKDVFLTRELPFNAVDVKCSAEAMLSGEGPFWSSTLLKAQIFS